jgi:hypothetical protein
LNDRYSAPVLGIDLGASFTKVAFRPAWKNGKYYETPCRLLLIGGNPLIPSLVIHRDNKRKPWLCGRDATRYRPLSSDQVFNNWKAGLFSSTLDVDVAGCLAAAGQFFEWLYAEITEIGIDVSSCRVKVCLPAFRDVDVPASILGQAMLLAGWNNISISRIAEPRANTIGVFSEGRNSLYCRGEQSVVNPLYMNMYPHGSALLNHLREFTLAGGPRHAIIAIVDIGSFTTDLSVIDFDATADADCIVNARQTSYEVGIIAGFEHPLLSELAARHRFVVSGLTFDERENIKHRLANGDQFVLTLPGSENVRIGDLLDQEAAFRIAAKFANEIWTAYVKETRESPPKYVLLTGGGSAAPIVREAVYSAFKNSPVRWVPVEGIESPSEGTGPLRRWPDSGAELARVATALGSASVIIDLPVSPPLAEQPRPRRVESPWIACSCQGGNKDCIRCGGRGMYKHLKA